MNLINFLKKSSINNEFIDDFFGLYNPNDKYNFVINLEDIAKWTKFINDEKYRNIF